MAIHSSILAWRIPMGRGAWQVQFMGFSRPEYCGELPFLSPGDLPNPATELRSPALQVNSLPAEPQGKPKNTGVGNRSLFQRIFLTQESNGGLLHCRQILYQLGYKELNKFAFSLVMCVSSPHHSFHQYLIFLNV